MPMIEAVLSMSGMALVAGVGLGFAAKKFHVESDPMVDKLDEALPATNCGNCGYPGCRPYAEALMGGGVEINLCSPGGKATMEMLASILGVEPAAMEEDEGPTLAFIWEEKCIGCTACIKACPVDAIVGANKQSHTVIAAECTACKACIEPCPVDCITMEPVEQTVYDWMWSKPSGPSFH
ncbi:MAG: electron transport complex subunit RsxB [Magnetococcales bacterium]|nr:electron transport complex subunit RsxB [Magnetococcales bacterium]